MRYTTDNTSPFFGFFRLGDHKVSEPTLRGLLEYGFLVGGLPARDWLGLEPGQDADIVLPLDSASAARAVLERAGWTRDLGSDAVSTMSDDPRVRAEDDPVAFRERWFRGDHLSFDLLFLNEDPSDLTPHAVGLVLGFDCLATQHIVGLDGWYATPGAVLAADLRSPLWRQGVYPTKPERRAKWDALLPGKVDGCTQT